MKQSRSHPRFRASLSAELNTAKRVFAAKTRDVSTGGCCVESAHPLNDGDRLRVSLFVVFEGVEDVSIPSLDLMASVRWVAQNDSGLHVAGLEYEGATQAQTTWLKQFLAKHPSS